MGDKGGKLVSAYEVKNFFSKTWFMKKGQRESAKVLLIFKAYVYWKQGPPLLHSKKCCETCPLGLEFGIGHPSNLEAKEMVFIDFFNYEDLNVEQF